MYLYEGRYIKIVYEHSIYYKNFNFLKSVFHLHIGFIFSILPSGNIYFNLHLFYFLHQLYKHTRTHVTHLYRIRYRFVHVPLRISFNVFIISTKQHFLIQMVVVVVVEQMVLSALFLDRDVDCRRRP